jgi:hypothetical protein
MNIKRIFAGALLSGGLAVAGMGITSPMAQADPASGHQWCPEQPMHAPTGPGADKLWDMNVCHTWYFVRYPFGNVMSTTGGMSNVWDGSNPPAGSLVDCGRDLFGFPIRC